MPTADADQRKAALEAKKAKLAQMRADKARRLEAQKAAGTESSTTSSGRSTRLSSRLAASRQRERSQDNLKNIKKKAENTSSTTNSTDVLLESLGLGNTSDQVAVSEPNNNNIQNNTENTTPITDQSNQQLATITVPTQPIQPKREPPKLSTTTTALLEILPRDVVTYAKETQTIVEEKDDDDDDQEINVDVGTEVAEQKTSNDEENNKENKTPDDEGLGGEEKNEEDKLTELQQQFSHKIRELTNEEKEKIFQTDSFQNFLEKTSTIVERAVTENDVCKSYIRDPTEQDLFDPMYGEKITLNRVFGWVCEMDVCGFAWKFNFLFILLLSQPPPSFNDDVWTSERTVSAITWSAIHPELVYVAYGPKEKNNLNEPEGIICVWNTDFKKESPEFIFHCSSPITSLCLSPYAPNLVIGGTYSGKVVVWDKISRKRTPVQRSKHRSEAHTHPIFCLQVVGTSNAHNLISISSDGRCCTWSLDMLALPTNTLDLQYPDDKRRPISVQSSSFPRGNTNNFLIGCTDGGVFQGQRHGEKNGINRIFGSNSSRQQSDNVLSSMMNRSYASSTSSNLKDSLGHSGPVYGLSAHEAAGAIDFSDLFLTASADYSIKLWSNKNPQTQNPQISSSSSLSSTLQQKSKGDLKDLHKKDDENKSSSNLLSSTSANSSNPITGCIHTFKYNQDFIYAIRWSPTHPAVFATGDGQANIDIWNLNQMTEFPFASYKLRGGASAVSCLSFNKNGNLLAVGDDQGRVEILELAEEFSNPKMEEWNKMLKTVDEMTHTSTEDHYDIGISLGGTGNRSYGRFSRYGGSGDHLGRRY